MNPVLKYTLGRVGLFLAIALPLMLLRLNILLTLMIALLGSMILSYFLLRAWRDELSEHVERGVVRRREERERLRSALAGDEDDQADRK